jgi:hypothetical protein
MSVLLAFFVFALGAYLITTAPDSLSGSDVFATAALGVLVCVLALALLGVR